MADSVHCSHEGRDVKSQREGETKREGWGEMDRGEDRDFLSSGFFDGSHGCLYNKRLIANDSNRKKKGGGGITSIQMHSAIQVSCSGDQGNKTRLSSETPDRRFHNQNHCMKLNGVNQNVWFSVSERKLHWQTSLTNIQSVTQAGHVAQPLLQTCQRYRSHLSLQHTVHRLYLSSLF